METYKVYIRVDEQGRIVAVNSDAFLDDTDGWTLLDEGTGDRYHHAQGNYLPGPLTDERGVYRYKLVKKKIVERTIEEMDLDYHPPVQEPSDIDLALIELAGMIIENSIRLDEQDAALIELASMISGGVS